MQTLAKFQVEKTAFGAAVRQLLVSQAGVDASAISEGDSFAVWPRPGGESFSGISPLLSVVGSSSAAKQLVGGSSPELRAATMQWCTLAAQLAANQVSLADVEARVNIPPGLATSTTNVLVPIAESNNAPTAADLLLLSSLKGQDMKRFKIEAPNVYKWAEKVLKQNEICQQFGSLSAAETTVAAAAEKTSASAAAAATTTTSEKPQFAVPDAAEIAARRAAKEQAKKEKAEKDKAAGIVAPAAGGASSSSNNNKAEKESEEVHPDSGLDLRVGKITSIKAHPEAERLYVESVDLAEASGPRTIVSGLVQFYKPEELLNQYVVVVCNMKPRKLVGVESQGMVLCASTEQAVKIIQPSQSSAVKPGDCVTFGKNVAAAVAGKAIPSTAKMGQLLQELKTDENGVVMWKDIPLTIGAEIPITAPLKSVPVK